MPQNSFESVPFAANQVTSNEPLVLGKPACFAFVMVIFLHIYWLASEIGVYAMINNNISV